MSTTRPTGKMHAPRELHVNVVSPEETDFGIAEFWVGESLAEALARAKQLLESP